MGRININQLDKIEELPSKLSINKALLKDAGGTGKIGNLWDIKDYKEFPYVKVRNQVMRGSIGMNWDEVVKKIKEKIPEELIAKHPWVIEEPDTIRQSSETGQWSFVDYWGRFENWRSFSGDTPSEVKKNQKWEKYYLDKQRRLKFIPNKDIPMKETITASQRRAEKKQKELIGYLESIADYVRKPAKSSWRNEKEYLTRITFKHPTKTQERRRYDKETNKWVGIGIFDPIDVTLTIPQFKSWCEKEGKTYFIFDGENYHTNLKWSFKQ